MQITYWKDCNFNLERYTDPEIRGTFYNESRTIGIIQGVAGSRKTYFSSAVIAAIVADNPTARILCVVLSNSATDVLARSIVAASDKCKLDVFGIIRVHSDDAEYEHLMSFHDQQYEILQVLRDQIIDEDKEYMMRRQK